MATYRVVARLVPISKDWAWRIVSAKGKVMASGLTFHRTPELALAAGRRICKGAR